MLGGGGEQIDNFSVRFFFTFRIFFVSAEFGFILLLFCVYIFCALEYKAKSNTDVILNSNSDYYLKHGSTNNPVWECFAKTKRIYKNPTHTRQNPKQRNSAFIAVLHLKVTMRPSTWSKCSHPTVYITCSIYMSCMCIFYGHTSFI